MATTRMRIDPLGRLSLSVAAACALVVAMALDTRVVRIGSPSDLQAGAFSPDAYGAAEFPKVQAAVESRAVDAATLAAAIGRDQSAAGARYGVAADAGPEIPVRFTGTAGEEDSGLYDVTVPGLPDAVHVTVQTGPAIIGTDLRDATGAITFEQFHNQIEYQNAGSALNRAMKKAVLSGIDTGKLHGRRISVIGVFQLTDPGSWQVTPVRLDVP